MKCRVRPFADRGRMTVLNRVVVHVVHMPSEIIFVAQQMFPISPLPDSAFALACAAIAQTLSGRDATRESCLCEHPACWEVSITLR